MRILIFHGYLLGGTGSNVYNARLAASLAGLGHEVHLVCQDRDPERLPFVDAVGSWDAEGVLLVRARREPVRVTVYRPEIGRLLPVYVLDRYEGFEARRFADCSAAEIDGYVARNVAAVGEVAERAGVELGLANHLVMGPVIVGRALGRLGIPYAVKVHGSALEYTVKPEPERFLPYAREGLAGARTVLVGSRHTGESLWAAVGQADLPSRTRLGPPGVEISQFGRRERPEAAAGLRAVARRLGGGAEASPGMRGDTFAVDGAAAGRALAGLDPAVDRIVAYTGKLIVSKGVDLLLAAWPLVHDRVPEARLVIVGFGEFRAGLEELAAALGRGDLAGVRRLAERGRELEGGVAGPLGMLISFVDRIEAGDGGERYAAAGRAAAGTISWTGRLEHAEIVDLLPACEVQVVPSTFPESFGMVAVEAAACGTLPISADHSGLAEVSRTLAGAVPAGVAGWLSFGLGPDAVDELADRLIGWLEAPAELRVEASVALARVARERYSWEGVARGVIAAAEGRLDDLERP
ncbi:MAG TPA: glycosyltransferase family 4 protein [Solirubrobacteraceae bacterium]|nr:glycosyltransferase family 4 protein [Solirubrobacteraceae bacterium]